MNVAPITIMNCNISSNDLDAVILVVRRYCGNNGDASNATLIINCRCLFLSEVFTTTNVFSFVVNAELYFSLFTITFERPELYKISLRTSLHTSNFC